MIRDTSQQDRPIDAARMRAPWRRWLWPSLIALVVLLAVIWVARNWLSGSSSVSAERLRIAEVTRGTFVRDAAVNGRVVAAVSPTLYAPVQSTVELKIQAGATVRQGDVLIELDSPELSNELQREQSTLQQLQAEADSARIEAQRQRLESRREADEAAIELQAAERELQRAQRALDAGVMAQVDFMRARDSMESARVRARNAQARTGLAVQSSTSDVETRRQQSLRQELLVGDLRRRVDELKVRSPVDGIVGTVSVADRANVAANAPLLTVVDLSKLEVELTAPESYADELGLGMPVEVNIGGAMVAGKLTAISPEVVDNEVLVRVGFEGEQPPGLRQNQRVSARIVIDERPDVVMLARGPFVEQGGGRYVYVVQDGVAVRRPVTLGASSIAQVEVLQGLKTGERVVISGADSFGQSENVRISR